MASLVELGVQIEIAERVVAVTGRADGIRLMDFAMAAQWASGGEPARAMPAGRERRGLEACLVSLGVGADSAARAVALGKGDGLQTMELALSFDFLPR